MFLILGLVACYPLVFWGIRKGHIPLDSPAWRGVAFILAPITTFIAVQVVATGVVYVLLDELCTRVGKWIS